MRLSHTSVLLSVQGNASQPRPYKTWKELILTLQFDMGVPHCSKEEKWIQNLWLRWETLPARVFPNEDHIGFTWWESMDLIGVKF